MVGAKLSGALVPPPPPPQAERSKTLKKNKRLKLIHDEEAQNNYKEMIASQIIQQDSILTSKSPNIVLIVLESFTSAIIEELGGKKGVTPNFHSLSEEGVMLGAL